MRTNETIELANGTKARLFQFETATEMANYTKTACAKALENHPAGNWEGGTWDEADQRARLGQFDLVAPSDLLLDRMEEAARMDAHAFQIMNSVAGGVPNVPAFLSGHPLAMRQRRRVMTQEAPVVVLASQWIVAGARHESIARRGAAVLALVRKLAEFRPVALHVYIGLGDDTNTLTTFRVETSPLDLARAAWALSSPNVIRHFGHAFHGKANRAHNGYMGGYQLDDDDATVAHLLGAEEWISTPNLIGTEFDSDESAATWVLEQLKIHAGERLSQVA